MLGYGNRSVWKEGGALLSCLTQMLIMGKAFRETVFRYVELVLYALANVISISYCSTLLFSKQGASI